MGAAWSWPPRQAGADTAGRGPDGARRPPHYAREEGTEGAEGAKMVRWRTGPRSMPIQLDCPETGRSRDGRGGMDGEGGRGWVDLGSAAGAARPGSRATPPPGEGVGTSLLISPLPCRRDGSACRSPSSPPPHPSLPPYLTPAEASTPCRCPSTPVLPQWFSASVG